jgi:hypothetical protein
MVWDNVSWGIGTPVNESILTIKENLNVLYNALGSNPDFSTMITDLINNHKNSTTAHTAANIVNIAGPIVKSTDIQKAINELGSFQNFGSTQIGTEETDLGVEIKGRTLINLLGTDGNFDNLTGWTVNMASISTNKAKYGANSVRLNPTSGVTNYGYAYKDYTQFDPNKFYIAIADAYIASWVNKIPQLSSQNYNAWTNNTRSNFDITKLNQWQSTYIKITAKVGGVRLFVGSFDNGTEEFDMYVDGLRVYEVDQATYNKIDVDPEYTGDRLVAKFPYVDSVQFKANTMITAKTKNLIPAFNSGEWSLHANTVVNSTYSLTLNATANYQQSAIYIPCKPNSQYVFKFSGSIYYKIESTDNNKTYLSQHVAWGSALSFTFTTNVNASYILIYIANTTTSGTFTFTNPQLELGSTATPFEPQVKSIAHCPIKLADSESVYISKDQAAYNQTWRKDIQLTGDLAWVQSGATMPATSSRLIYIPYFANDKPWVGNSAAICIKYNGIPLVRYTTNDVVDHVELTSGYSLYINAANSDTGFSDAMIATAAEVKAFFYGWRMCASNGGTYVSGTKYWKKITDGTGITSTIPTASYAGYTPYTLHYKLATPVMHYDYIDNDVNQPIISLNSFLNVPVGITQIEQVTGVDWSTKQVSSSAYASTIPLISVDNMTTTRSRDYLYAGLEQNIAYYQLNSNGMFSAYSKAASDAKYAPKNLGIGGYVKQLNSIDIRTIKVGGRYYCNGCTNTPTTFNGYLDVMPITSDLVAFRFTVYNGATYECQNIGGTTWTPWSQVATINSFEYSTEITGTDWNTLIKNGKYYVIGASALAINGPLPAGDTNHIFYVDVINGTTGRTSYVSQQATNVVTGNLCTRKNQGGTWSPWRQIATIDNPVFTGNVGIGTVPRSLGTNLTTLEIKSNAVDKTGGLLLSNPDNSVRSYFYHAGGSCNIGSWTDNPLSFHVNGTERMRIESNGYIGIGTSPKATLHSAGTTILGLAPGTSFYTSGISANQMGFYLDEASNGFCIPLKLANGTLKTIKINYATGAITVA